MLITFSIFRMPNSVTRMISLRPSRRTTTIWWRSRSHSTWRLQSTGNFSKAKKVVSVFLSRDHPNPPARRPSAAAASSASGPLSRKRTWPRWSQITPEKEPSSSSPLRRTPKPSGSPTGTRSLNLSYGVPICIRNTDTEVDSLIRTIEVRIRESVVNHVSGPR